MRNNLKIEVTPDELKLITTLLSDQLFRREFIDPKMPGFKRDPGELAMGKNLVVRLKSMAQEAFGLPAGAASGRVPERRLPNVNRVPDAV